MGKSFAKQKSILRVACRRKAYSQLGNEMLKDKGLSLEALGVIVFILSFPDNWTFELEWLCRERNVGRDRARRLLAELEAHGYCKRERARNCDGTLGAYEYVFTDEPWQFDEPEPENPGAGKPGPGKPGRGKSVTGNPGPGKSVDNNKERTSTKKNTNTPLPPQGVSEELISDLKSEVALGHGKRPANAQATRKNISSFPLTPCDAQWKIWIDWLISNGLADRAAAAIAAGRLTVLGSRLPKNGWLAERQEAA